MKSLFKIVAILLFCAMVGYYFFDKKQQEESYGPSIDGMQKSEWLSLKKNIMLMGVDERPEDHDMGRSDTLMVIMLDTNTKNVSLLSIPRDTRVHIPRHGWDKINHAYAFGQKELTRRTVEEFLGIKISNYVMVDFKGFTGLVDAIGGVDIDVEQDMYYRDSWDGFTVDLKKGMQHMDGKTAIQYVRYRDEEGDIGRVRRQQHFMMAMYDKISSEQLLIHIPGLAKQLTSMVKTDLQINEMISLGQALHSMVKEKGIKMNTVPGEGRYIQDISYYIPYVQQTRQLMAEMQGAEMTGRYKSAAELMAAEYKKNIDEVTATEAKDKNKDKKLQTDAKQKSLEADKSAGKAGTALKKLSQEERLAKAKKSRSSLVVRVVNCSGAPAAGDVAANRLRSAGYRVIRGGSGAVIAETTVIANTNNGAVVSRLAHVPFAHRLKITKNGATDCDGVIMLGKNFR